MKKLLAVFVVAVFTLAIGCKTDDKAGGGDKASGGAAVSAEMTAFMGGLTGASDKTEAALKKHGVKGLDTKDMEMYNLKDAKVTKTEKKGKQTCHMMEAKSGMTTRTYNVCWENKKIAAVEDKGMK